VSAHEVGVEECLHLRAPPHPCCLPRVQALSSESSTSCTCNAVGGGTSNVTRRATSRATYATSREPLIDFFLFVGGGVYLLLLLLLSGKGGGMEYTLS